MSIADDRIEIEAIGWRLRVPTLDPAGWIAFTDWLEADPRHAVAYDLVVASEENADALLRLGAAVPAEVLDPVRARRSLRPVWYAAAAALLAAVVAGGLSLRGGAPPRPDMLIATGPGEQRTVRLADGSMVSLNADSRLAIDATTPRRVRLDQGEAAFTIVHHADHPFEVRAGATVLRDVGTVFDVARRIDGLEVAVGEGAVAYDPDGSNVVLAAGQAARLRGDPAMLEIHDIDRRAVAAWRTGRLTYRDAPLAWVAADVGRALGRTIVVDPAFAGRPFSGTIIVTRDDAVMRARLAGLLGATVLVEPHGWRLRPRAGN